MKKIYLKPTIERLTIIESGGIMDGISRNAINGATTEEGRDNQISGGGTGDGTDMGAKGFNPDWDFDPDWNFDEQDS